MRWLLACSTYSPTKCLPHVRSSLPLTIPVLVGTSRRANRIFLMKVLTIGERGQKEARNLKHSFRQWKIEAMEESKAD